MLEIPIKQFPEYTELVPIEGITYRFDFKWNTRGTFWTFSISNPDGTEILSGIKIVPNFELIADFVATDVPPGLLYAVDPSDTTERIGRNDLGNQVKLIYMTEAERAAIQ